MTTAYDELTKTIEGKRAMAIEITLTTATECLARRMDAAAVTRETLAQMSGISADRIAKFFADGDGLMLRELATLFAYLDRELTMTIKPLFEKPQSSEPAPKRVASPNKGRKRASKERTYPELLQSFKQAHARDNRTEMEQLVEELRTRMRPLVLDRIIRAAFELNDHKRVCAEIEYALQPA